MSGAAELYELAADLTAAPAEARKNVVKATQVSAHHIKDDWRQGAERTGLEGYAAKIDYDLEDAGTEVSAEIGPQLGGQGSLGLVEDAPGGVQSAPQHAGRDALEANENDYVRGLEIAVFDAIAET
ncbi:hypothetical protein [Microbacterium gilvum]|uniref:HK97 gp10 family phage protein n=1 Tax=Microbacterium gilvum TaxID=1336204 RepID=A0ABP8ZQC9_9MICO